MMDDDKKTENKKTGNKKAVNRKAPDKTARAKSAGSKAAADKKRKNKGGNAGAKKNSSSGAKKSNAPDTKKDNALSTENSDFAALRKTESKEEIRKKIKNSNLRLVKNGDSPVKETPAEKSPEKEQKGQKAAQETGKEKPEEETRKEKPEQETGKEEPEEETGKEKPEQETEKKKTKKALKKEKAGKGSEKVKPKKASQKGKTSKKKRERDYEKPVRSKREQDYFEDRFHFEEWYIQNRSLVIIGFTVFAVIALLASGYYFIITNYKVTTVYVDGNVHYTNEEVMNMVMNGTYGDNSLFLSLKYKDKGVEGVPFVEKMDVNILSPDTIRINVYEKAIAGYVEYLGQYMYFDKDGIIVESSDVRTKGVPQVTGLNFNYVVMHEPLPVEDDAIFKQILSITQLLGKYELNADKIFFDSTYDMTLYFGGVRVNVESDDEVDEKLMKLPGILPALEGKSGMLHYMNDGKSISFSQD